MEDGGALSLICVGSAFARYIFLFDVVCLTRFDLQPLLSLLAGKVIKVVWDGRMDFIEILTTYGVGIAKNVCDLQVAEVLSRSKFRGEGENDRLGRLAKYFGTDVWKSRDRYAGMHKIIGLQQCLEDNGYNGLVGKDPEVTDMHRRNDTQLWMNRPLLEKLLCYAAADIYLITLLYEDFASKGWLYLGSKFFGRCNRYVSMHEEHGRIRKDTRRFRAGPLMPLGILNGGELRNCWKTQCITCGRSLTLFAFETDGQGSRRQVCRLCWAVAAKYRFVCDERWVRIDIKTTPSSL